MRGRSSRLISADGDVGDKDGDYEDEDDDFVREAVEEAKEYKAEAERERRARAEAKLLNKRYVKRKKKEKISREDDQILFHRLRQLLGLTEQEAHRLRKSSDETMMKREADSDGIGGGSGQRSDDDGKDDAEEQPQRGQSSGQGQFDLSQLLGDNATYATSCSSKNGLISLSSTTKREISSDPKEEDRLARSPSSQNKSIKREQPPASSDADEHLIPLSFPVKKTLAAHAPRSVDHQEGSSGTKEERARGNGNDEEEEEAIPLSLRGRIHGQQLDTIPAAVDVECRPSFFTNEEQRKVGPMCLDASADVYVPRYINRFLREYQRDGVRFFYEAYRNGRGALLGDDMGLGKTIQVIAFLSAIMKKRGTVAEDENRRINAVRAGRSSSGKQQADKIWATCLIICPSSVVGNWQSELNTWGYFEHATVSRDSIDDFEKGRLDILLTSHETAKLQIDRLKDLSFSCIFIDECHKVKNPSSQLHQAMCSFACPRRFGLTGTAIQNRVEEMWTLLDWCNPDLYGTLRHWRELVAEPLRRGQVAGHHPLEVDRARDIANRLVKNLFPRSFLRRTKSLIQDQLPIKTDKIVFCPLTHMQIAAYKRILNEPECVMIRRSHEACECGLLDDEGFPYQRKGCCCQTTADGKPWNYYMFRYLHLLQSCSNHLALVFPDPQDNIVAPIREIDRERKVRYLRQLETVQRLFPDDWAWKQNNSLNGFREDFCGKWIVLKELMADWKRRGDKVLIFTSNKSLLNWLSSFIEMQGTQFLRLDGTTPQKKRQSLVDSFNRRAEIFAFLISTTAGGTGLNLTGANKVVVFDPNWNPAHDLQAMDRAYRFGQVRDVDVFRLIGKGSLEEVVYDRQLYKQQMGRIGYEASKERRYFQKGMERGIKHLFELHETELKTKRMIEDCDIREAKFAFEQFARDQHLAAAAAGVEAPEMDLDDFVKGYLDETSDGRKRKGKRTDNDGDTSTILKRGGVEYTHVNDELMGGSRAEEAMSRYAKEKMAGGGSGRGKRRKGSLSEKGVGGSGQRAASATIAWPPKRNKNEPEQEESDEEEQKKEMEGTKEDTGPSQKQEWKQDMVGKAGHSEMENPLDGPRDEVENTDGIGKAVEDVEDEQEVALF